MKYPDFESTLRMPDGLNAYLTSDFQELIHLALGVAVVVHTIVDGKLIIRKRSLGAANDNDGGKLAMSANEGLDPKRDVDDAYPNRTRDFKFIVNSCLEEELFGPPASDSSQPNLIQRIREYKMTGVCLYTPNLSLVLCFLVSVDCTADDVQRASVRAKHSSFEFLNERKLPSFTTAGIRAFLEDTTRTGRAQDTWDEGSLVAVLLSTFAIR